MKKFLPRRSALYVPGSNKRALEKAPLLNADLLIIDLEDSVAPSSKELARNLISTMDLRRQHDYQSTIVRINSLKSEWGGLDISAIANLNIDGILIPKIEDASMVTTSEEIISDLIGECYPNIWLMMETPKAILNAHTIAAASKRIEGLIMGTTDLHKELHAYPSKNRDAMITSMGLCLLAARAEGLIALDGVHMNLDDDEGFIHACNHGRILGFDGKTLIHPKTIDQANRIFSPKDEDLNRAKRIIKAHKEAEMEGKGVTVLDGTLIEALHVSESKRLLALNEIISKKINPEESNSTVID